MKKWLALIAIVGSLFFSSVVIACDHEGACGKACTLGPHFITPKDGDVVSSDVKIKMGITGMKVHKAGELIEGTGHHHLIIDGSPVTESEVVPKDDKHIHFGKGQTETVVNLKPGKHTLTLQFADGHHQSYGKMMSHSITVTVE